MDLRVNFSKSLVAAVFAAEVLSFFWGSDFMPWRNKTNYRFLSSSILADICLAVVLQNITRSFWKVRCGMDAAILSFWLALIYACLEGPHMVWNSRSFVRFFFHILHKFAMLTAMLYTMMYFDRYMD